jgi:phenylpyruvate tautomerase PptA (4-oxalocrotonate tautomerase family)
MPLLKLETTVALSDDKRNSLLSILSKIVAESIGKPETYVMVTINRSAILMAGKAGDAAFVDVRSIGGLSSEVNRQLSQKICATLKQTLGIEPNRIYLNFSDIDAANWGSNGSTFG